MSKLRYAGAALALSVGLIAGWEGKHNRAYLDLVQVPTVCYGHTRNVRMGDVKSDEECTRLLWAEVRRLDDLLRSWVPARLPDYVRASLISWMYNVGEGNARNSTLIRKLRAGDITGACNELPRWSYAKGKHIRGLYNRRKDEQQLCLGEKK